MKFGFECVNCGVVFLKVGCYALNVWNDGLEYLAWRLGGFDDAELVLGVPRRGSLWLCGSV